MHISACVQFSYIFISSVIEPKICTQRQLVNENMPMHLCNALANRVRSALPFINTPACTFRGLLQAICLVLKGMPDSNDECMFASFHCV